MCKMTIHYDYNPVCYKAEDVFTGYDKRGFPLYNNQKFILFPETIQYCIDFCMDYASSSSSPNMRVCGEYYDMTNEDIVQALRVLSGKHMFWGIDEAKFIRSAYGSASKNAVNEGIVVEDGKSWLRSKLLDVISDKNEFISATVEFSYPTYWEREEALNNIRRCKDAIKTEAIEKVHNRMKKRKAWECFPKKLLQVSDLIWQNKPHLLLAIVTIDKRLIALEKKYSTERDYLDTMQHPKQRKGKVKDGRTEFRG